LAQLRIGHDVAGFAELLGVLAEHGDNGEELIPVAIETSRGLLVTALRATGRAVFAINPLSVSRYRDRHSAARRKSDPRRCARARASAAHRHGSTPAVARR